jgi:endonuclease/exonuclease/phosphatase (EEP) superfamily protein YafD
MAERNPHRLKEIVFVLAAAGVVALMLLILSRFFGWVYPLELFSHFQIQYLLAAGVLALVLAGLRRWRWCLTAVACAVVAATAVAPYVLPGGVGAAHAHATAGAGARPQLRLLLANLLVRNRDHERALAAVRQADADVLVFQEVDAAWMEALAPLREDYPYVVREPRGDCFGLAVFSRIRPDEAQVVYPGGTSRPTAFLQLRVDGRRVRIVATHPIHPVSAATFASRNAQLDAVGAYVAGLEGPKILIGDLNMTMWSPWYRQLCARTGLVNARHGLGLVPTWPTFLPPFMRIPIDQCLVSEDLAVTACRTGSRTGSDHFPLIVDVAVGVGMGSELE